MSSLFDLPFEDDPDEARERRPGPSTPTDAAPDARPGSAPAGPPEREAGRGPAPAPSPPPREPRIYTVGALTQALRRRLEDAFPRVWVEGELAECRKWQSGHVYFTLKDGDAQLQGVMFRTEASGLRFAPAAGLHVLVRGRVSVYQQKGQYQLVADAMEPRGAGALQVAFDQIKRRLQAEGLFDASRKRALPVLPRRVGVVTSPDGAALRDILRVLRTRHAPVDVVIGAARVQGEGAAADLARALRRVSSVAGVDVIIIGRGGGAAEDLWAFNDEHLARAIAACPVPVVAAVGHEIDTTIADFVADVRAATPSQAAALVVDQAAACADRLRAHRRHLEFAARASVERRRVALLHPRRQRALGRVREAVAARDRARVDATLALLQVTRARVAQGRARLAATRERLEAQHPQARLAERLRRLMAADRALAQGVPDVQDGRRRVDGQRHRLGTLADGLHHRAAGRLAALAGRLENLSPLRTLARGYAVCWDEAHTRLIRSVRDTTAGGTVHVQVTDGELHCRVESTRPPRLDRS